MATRTHDLILPADVIADRPAASTVPSGALFTATDENKIYRNNDTGTAWALWMDLSAIGGGGAAEDTTYDNTASDLSATNVQDAIDETVSIIDGVGDPIDDPTRWGTNLGFDAEWSSGDPAVPSGWAWTNQNTATATNTFDRLLIVAPNMGSNQMRIIEQPLTSFPSTWEATVKIPGTRVLTGSFWQVGIQLRDSASSRIINFALGMSNTNRSVDLWRWNSTTSLNTATTTTALAFFPRFLRIKKNSSTSYDFMVSSDGVAWGTHTAAYDVSAFVASPSHIGIHVQNNAVEAQGTFDWFRVR